MHNAPRQFRIACTSDGSQNVSQSFDPGEVGRGHVVTDIFFDAGTSGGFTTATITDQYGKDILNGLGAAAVTADTLYTWSDLGGLGFSGPLTVTMTGAGASKACAWNILVV